MVSNRQHQGSQQPETLTIKVGKIIYQSPEFNIVVAKVETDAAGRPSKANITALIDGPTVMIGDSLQVQGAWIQHAKYGRQFRCRVEGFRGEGASLLEAAHALGLGESVIGILMRLPYTVKAEAKGNPYCLVQSTGLRWGVIDRLANQLGVPQDSVLRIEGYLDYLFQGRHQSQDVDRGLQRSSGTSLPVGLVLRLIHEDLGLQPRLTTATLDTSGSSEYTVVTDLPAYDNTPAIMPSVLKVGEESICYSVDCFRRAPASGVSFGVLTLPPTITELQQQAIWTAANMGISLITGPPGSGKTTCIAELVKLILAYSNLQVGVVAFTGKAADRLNQVIYANLGEQHTKFDNNGSIVTATLRLNVSTIHRFLECQPNPSSQNGFTFLRGPGNPVAEEVVIVDEASMVPMELMDSLLSAIRPSTRVVLVGDVNQLQPLSPGCPFRDMLASNRLATVALDKIHRQAAGSAIAEASRVCLAGEPHAFFTHIRSPEAETEIKWLPTADQDIPMVVLNIYRKNCPNPWAGEMTILAPTRQGIAGTLELNKTIKNALNPSPESSSLIELSDGIRTHGLDPVMWIKNDYERKVFNGDMFFAEIIRTKGRNTILPLNTFADKAVGISETKHEIDSQDAAKYLVMAYTMTIHKAQGSEWPDVVVVMPGYAIHMAERSLLYTAISRAKSRLWLVGSRDFIKTAIGLSPPPPRTRLSRMLAGLPI